jgi:hypothetical protein
LKDKKAVVGAFVAAKLTLIDGNPVPQKLWTAWIPDKPNLPGDNEYPNSVVIPITKQKGSAPRKFRYRHRTFLKTPGSFALLEDKGMKQDRKDALEQELTKLDRYKDTHPFPEFKRYGYNTMGEFMDGWDWDFKYDKSSKTLFFNGSRHEYTLIQPIVEVKTGELVLNFYPTTKKGSVLELLKPSDTRFFASF